MARWFPDLPETRGGWVFAVTFGLIGLIVVTFQQYVSGAFADISVVIGVALTVFALTDAYLIADTLDELEDAPDIEAIADGGSYEVRE
jgi:hypothetical protein